MSGNTGIHDPGLQPVFWAVVELLLARVPCCKLQDVFRASRDPGLVSVELYQGAICWISVKQEEAAGVQLTESHLYVP